MNDPIKIMITGAAGQIGYQLLFRIASGAIFGDRPIQLQLLELPQAMSALEGVVMELDDCAFPYLKGIKYTDSIEEAAEGVNWALLVGSVPRKQGMERSDLLKINGEIFTKQGKALNDRASQDIRTFVVGNPCNTNCFIAMSNAHDIPSDRFYAMTMLDELRARHQLATKAKVDITDVTKMTIWGNHSATQYPDFYHALIKGRSAYDVIGDDAWFKETFVPRVQQRGAEVLKLRGASSAASAANAAIEGVKRLITDTPAGESYSMCIPSKGHYGVDEKLVFSFPCITKNGKLEVVEGLEFNDYAQDKFNLTLNELRQERDTVKDLGLVE